MKKFLNFVILILAGSLAYQLNQIYPMVDLASVLTAVQTAPTPAPTTGVTPAVGTGGPSSPTQSATPTPLSPSASTAETPAATADTGSGQPALFGSEAPVAGLTPAANGAETAVNPTATAATPDVTAASTPAPVDLSSVEHRLWPKLIKLKKRVEFEVSFGGKAVVNPGVMVKLRNIQGSRIEVEMTNGSKPILIPAADTDIEERIRLMKPAGL